MIRFLGPLLLLSAIPTLASATVIRSWSGTTPDTSIDVRFQAELSISGDALTIILRNDSMSLEPPSPSRNPNDLLSSFYFDIVDGFGNRPALTYESAIGALYLADADAADVLQSASADLVASSPGDRSWQFKDGLTLQPGSGVLSFGIGAVGNNSLSPNSFNGNIVDGIDFAIYAGDVTTRNLDGRLLVRETATFTFSGAFGFAEGDIAEEALFGLGTQPDSTGYVPPPGGPNPVPEPATGLLLGLALAGLGCITRSRGR